jgi:hypothetical protein
VAGDEWRAGEDRPQVLPPLGGGKPFKSSGLECLRTRSGSQSPHPENRRDAAPFKRLRHVLQTGYWFSTCTSGNFRKS